MIFDKLENLPKYELLDGKFVKAFDFIKETDLENTEAGTYKIDGDDVYAIISNYQTKDASSAHPEAHRKYADVQYMINGSELIGYSFRRKQKLIKEYDEEKDFMLYDKVDTFVKLEEGMFAVFYPDDLHMPGIMEGEPKAVKKLVIKVKL